MESEKQEEGVFVEMEGLRRLVQLVGKRIPIELPGIVEHIHVATSFRYVFAISRK